MNILKNLRWAYFLCLVIAIYHPVTILEDGLYLWPETALTKVSGEVITVNTEENTTWMLVREQNKQAWYFVEGVTNDLVAQDTALLKKDSVFIGGDREDHGKVLTIRTKEEVLISYQDYYDSIGASELKISLYFTLIFGPASLLLYLLYLKFKRSPAIDLKYVSKQISELAGIKSLGGNKYKTVRKGFTIHLFVDKAVVSMFSSLTSAENIRVRILVNDHLDEESLSGIHKIKGFQLLDNEAYYTFKYPVGLKLDPQKLIEKIDEEISKVEKILSNSKRFESKSKYSTIEIIKVFTLPTIIFGALLYLILTETGPPHPNESLAISTGTIAQVEKDEGSIYYYYEDNSFFVSRPFLNDVYPPDFNPKNYLNAHMTVEYYPGEPERLLTLAIDGEPVITYEEYAEARQSENIFVRIAILMFSLIPFIAGYFVLRYRYQVSRGRHEQFMMYPKVAKVSENQYRFVLKGYTVYASIEKVYNEHREDLFEKRTYDQLEFRIDLSNKFSLEEIKRINRMRNLVKNVSGKYCLLVIPAQPFRITPKHNLPELLSNIKEAEKWSTMPLRRP